MPVALGPQDNLQIIMMVAMWMAGQPVDKASFSPCLSGQFCVMAQIPVWGEQGREQGGDGEKERVNREVVLKLE